MDEERSSEERESARDLGNGEHYDKMKKIVVEVVQTHRKKRERPRGQESDTNGATEKKERKTKEEME